MTVTPDDIIDLIRLRVRQLNEELDHARDAGVEVTISPLPTRNDAATFTVQVRVKHPKGAHRYERQIGASIAIA